MFTLGCCPPSIFPLPTTALPTLQGALKDGFGEAVMAYVMPEPRKFSPFDSCQKRILWTHKEVYLAQHPVVCLVLQVGDEEKSLRALGFKSLNPFLRISKQSPCFTAIEERRGDKRLVELELDCEANGVAPPDPV